jgi:hypothetical protein
MKFTEADIKSIGGLSRRERAMRGIGELVDLAIPAIKGFKEAAGRRGSLRRWMEMVEGACNRLREANSESALGFLLRKGVQAIATDWYDAVDVKWREYCDVASSNAVAEWYAPLYTEAIALPVNAGQQFSDQNIVGEDSSLRNRKFGRMISLERELFDDDQTGQIAKRAGGMGRGMATTEGIWAIYRFLGSARTYGPLTVPASNYSTTNPAGTSITSPFSTSLYSATTGNRPSSFTQLTMGAMKNAYQALLVATDPQNNRIVVNPDTLLVSAMDKINAALLLAPGLYPAVPGQSFASAANAPVTGGTVSAAGANQGVLAGMPGGVMSPNPWAGMGIKDVCERYMPDWACALGQKARGIVFQERDPLEVIQEGPNSGMSFSFDVVRYRSRRRFEVDWIGGGSRFWYLINDGTTTGQL